MSTAASQDVNWMLANLPGKRGFFTPKVTAVMNSLRDELTALGELRPEEDPYLTIPSYLAKDPSTFPEKMVDHVLTVSKGDGFTTGPVWMMMTSYVRARIGNHAEFLSDPRGDRYVDGHASLGRMDAVTPSFRLLVDELMDRSNVLMSHYVRQFHGDHLRLYRTLVSPQETETPILHPFLSPWTDSEEFAEEWKKGRRRLKLSALVPAECVWIAPGYGEGELIISPRSPWGHSIEVTEQRVLEARTGDSDIPEASGANAPVLDGAGNRAGQAKTNQHSLWRRLFRRT